MAYQWMILNLKQCGIDRNLEPLLRYGNFMSWHHFTGILFLTLVVSCLLSLIVWKGIFKWADEADVTFDLIKQKLTPAPILVLPDFSQPFELHCDALKWLTIIGEVLNQNGRLVAYYSEQLSALEHAIVYIMWSSMQLFKL